MHGEISGGCCDEMRIIIDFHEYFGCCWSVVRRFESTLLYICGARLGLSVLSQPLSFIVLSVNLFHCALGDDFRMRSYDFSDFYYNVWA